MTDRRCIGCWEIKNRNDLIKITANGENVVVKPNSTIFGRSVYLCYNKSCIEAVFKKKKIEKFFKGAVPAELKGQLLDELRNS